MTVIEIFLDFYLSLDLDCLQGDVLAPFLFVIVIDYISKMAAEDHGFVTHKEKKNESGRSLRSSTRPPERKLNDLDFADDIALLKSSED